DAPQGWYSVAVQSSNEAGTSHNVTYVDVIMGKPYDLPYVDNFDNPLSMYGNSTEMWIPYSQLDGVNRSATWGKGELADGGLALLGRSPSNSNTSGAIGMPVFSTLGMEDATITMSVRTASTCPPFKLLFEHYGTYEYTVVGSFTPEEGSAPEFTDLSFPLPAECLDLPAVKIMIVPEYSSTSQQFWMNRISVDGTSSASVESVNGNAGKIIGGNGVITLQGFGNEIVTVTAADGRTVAQTRATGDETNIRVDKGIYIVNAGKKVAKVIVK
ncbi:MAG: T9SS type A sorting domain-containing protein, partial [Muribaculaceae bacterium]|nr:T9SS type A sorting domain-containing protein [Muribaculaceae bacterium]